MPFLGRWRFQWVNRKGGDGVIGNHHRPMRRSQPSLNIVSRWVSA